MATKRTTKQEQDEPRSVTEETEPVVEFTRGPDGNVVPVQEEK